MKIYDITYSLSTKVIATHEGEITAMGYASVPGNGCISKSNYHTTLEGAKKKLAEKAKKKIKSLEQQTKRVQGILDSLK